MNNSIEYGLLVKSHGPEKAKELISNRYSIFGDQKPILIFHEAPKVEEENPRKIRKSFANKNLKEFLTTASKEYETYMPLNILWNQYIGDVLGRERDPRAIGSKMLTADWNGAIVSVVKARNPSLVGQRGIVLWEAKSMLVVVTPSNKIKQLPKNGTTFRITAGESGPTLLLVGSRMLFRSAERTTRKFKPHDVDDIQDLLS